MASLVLHGHSEDHKESFDWAASSASRRVANWNYRVQKQWRLLHLGQLLDSDYVTQLSRQYLMQLVASAVARVNEASWAEELQRESAKRGQGRNKLRTYRCFKRVLEPDDYVRALLPPSHRSALAQFRCGTAPLKIETGRYEGLPEQQRTCFACSHPCVESEFHVLIVELFANCERNLGEFALFNDEQKLCAILGRGELCRFSAKACKCILTRRFSLLYQ